MTQLIGRLADRLLGMVVPATTAGACPCTPGERLCLSGQCTPILPASYKTWAQLNCNCQPIDASIDCSVQCN
jgi:hypothetical protein